MNAFQADRSRFMRLALCAGLLVVAGWFAWYAANNAGQWKDRFMPRKLRVVDPGEIYASGQINRHLIRQVLTQRNIKEIISLVADDPNDPDEEAELAAARDLGIARVDYPLSGDGTGDVHAYASAVADMARAAREKIPVLIHCSSGAQRSNGATFYYRVLIEHRDADAAAQEMIHNGHDPRSNPMLIPYLNSHMAAIAQLLVAKCVLGRVPDPLPQIHHE